MENIAGKIAYKEPMHYGKAVFFLGLFLFVGVMLSGLFHNMMKVKSQFDACDNLNSCVNRVTECGFRFPNEYSKKIMLDIESAGESINYLDSLSY